MPVPAPCRILTRTPGGRRANCGSEPIAAAEFGADEIAVFTKSLAQRRDLNFQVLLGDNDAGPYAAEELAFGDQRSVGLQQDQEEIEGARPHLDRHTVGDQLAAAQQNAESAEFERGVGCCRARPVRALRGWIFVVEGGLGDIRGHGERAPLANESRPRFCALAVLVVAKLCKSRLCGGLPAPAPARFHDIDGGIALTLA
jgi:hypothetical protein